VDGECAAGIGVDRDVSLRQVAVGLEGDGAGAVGQAGQVRADVDNIVGVGVGDRVEEVQGGGRGQRPPECRDKFRRIESYPLLSACA
jgi:hypothetical protein